MNSVRTNVCIVGGGPGGMMLGLLLAKRGVDVLVLEGQENFDREFRGEVLQPSTSHLLDQLGLLEYILAEPHSKIDSGKVRLAGKEIAQISFNLLANARARSTPPASGETTVSSGRSTAVQYSIITGVAKR